jgi:hypothetical protein
LVLHLATSGPFGCGFFVDELYFLACSEHLSWGFVDMPPLFPAVTALVRALLGDSLLAVRLLPALSEAALVLLTGLLARGQNYGQAGAIDHYGPALGLPKAISGHLSYYLWGPRGYTGAVWIGLDDDRETLERLFQRVELAGHVSHPYSMPYEHFDVYVCRGLKMPVAELVTAETFGQPGLVDYRNPNLAEALRVLGFVQRFGFGIPTAQRELAKNGNPPLSFEVGPNRVVCRIRERR